MATENQKAVARKVLENVRKGQKISVSGAMNGIYSESSSRKPNRLTRSKGYQQEMSEYFPNDLLSKVHLELFKNKEWRARDAALEKAYRIKGFFKADKEVVKDEFESLTDEELMARKKAIIAKLKKT